MLRHKHPAAHALLHKRLFRRIHDVHETGRDDEIAAAAHQRLGNVSHHFAVHDLTVIGIIDIPLAAALLPLRQEVLVVDEPAAELEGRFAGAEFDDVPSQDRPRLRGPR